uniref:Uncharacterized protein n=1 Tax=Anopheles maculatus TaxID=74869 RepID=A0A182T691_9DIPT
MKLTDILDPASFSPSPKWFELELVLFLPSSNGVCASLSSAGVVSPPLNSVDDLTLDWAVLLTVVSMVELVLLVLEMVVVFSDTTVNVLLACCLVALSCIVVVVLLLDAFISTYS